MWLPAVMLGVAVYIACNGVGILTHPARGAVPWLGWLLIDVALVKASLWLYFARLRARYRTRF